MEFASSKKTEEQNSTNFQHACLLGAEALRFGIQYAFLPYVIYLGKFNNSYVFS